MTDIIDYLIQDDINLAQPWVGQYVVNYHVYLDDRIVVARLHEEAIEHAPITGGGYV